MTTHELARLLLKEPDVTVCIEGWTTRKIGIIQPQYLNDEDPDERMLIMASEDFEPERTQPDSSTVGQSEV